MNCEACLEQLDSWVDGELPEKDARFLTSHLEACEECQQQAIELQALLSATSSLPQTIEPPRDLWPQIAEHLAASPNASPVDPVRNFQPWARVLAASFLLFAVMAAGWLLRDRQQQKLEIADQQLTDSSGANHSFPADSREGGGQGLLVTSSDVTASGVQSAALGTEQSDLTLGLLNLELAIADVRKQVLQETRRDTAPNEELEVVERNLQVINAALLEIRAALEQQPENPFLHRQWAASLQQQAELLQWAGKLTRGT